MARSSSYTHLTGRDTAGSSRACSSVSLLTVSQPARFLLATGQSPECVLLSRLRVGAAPVAFCGGRSGLTPPKRQVEPEAAREVRVSGARRRQLRLSACELLLVPVRCSLAKRPGREG